MSSNLIAGSIIAARSSKGISIVRLLTVLKEAKLDVKGKIRP